ncbi:MAG: molybdopterin-dependent oxidoreductase [Spirochaetales bacterium]|nr:molybdopterin-dependent oxidoreductase [Spirochaetales bacterium]
MALALSSLDLLVVRDLFLSETARLAHYVLPAASFLERSELHTYRHYQMVALSRKVLSFPGIMDEYTFWHDLSFRLGFGQQYFPWEDESELNSWLLEPTGISIEELEQHPEGLRYKHVRYRKFENTPFPTPSGKFEFSSNYLERLGLQPLPEYLEPLYKRKKSGKYPFTLISGARKTGFYHSRYRNIERLRKQHPKAEVEIDPLDARKMNIREGDRIRISSEVGSIVLPAKIVPEGNTLPGLIQITHGWEKDENVNRLTFDLVNDPISGFPLLTSVPVRIEKYYE